MLGVHHAYVADTQFVTANHPITRNIIPTHVIFPNNKKVRLLLLYVIKSHRGAILSTVPLLHTALHTIISHFQHLFPWSKGKRPPILRLLSRIDVNRMCYMVHQRKDERG